MVHDTAQSLHNAAASIAGGSLFPSGGTHATVDGWLDGV